VSSPRTTFGTWPRAVRWSAYVAVVVVLALVAAAGAGVWAVRRPFPQTDGTIELSGLSAKVKVTRDSHGIPQVYADTSADLFYAQGYVQAQDRFWQMDAWRHITAGRLSELLGKDALDTDKFTRTMGWRRVAEKELELLDPGTVANLMAFSKGVTAYIRTHSQGELSLEYTLLSTQGLSYQPEDWTPVDSLSWLKAMAWDLQGNTADELHRAVLTARFTPTQIAELYPPYPYAEHRPIVDEGGIVKGTWQQGSPAPDLKGRPGITAALLRTRQAMDALPQLVGRGDGVGSNAWAVDGDHSTTGAPILANDPHLAPSVPGIWYQMGLHCNQVSTQCPYDVAGFTFAGVPGIVIGHNADIAWGFTNLEADVSDLYLEKIDGHTYRYAGKARPLVEHDESIKILGEDQPFRYTVRETKHGPLMSDVSKNWSTAGANAPAPVSAPDRGNGYAVSIAWTGLVPANTMDALFQIDRADDFASFRKAARSFMAPCQNLVYADRDGHIGYQAPGLIPIRRPGVTGDYPAPGWKKRYDWTGEYVPFDALPYLLDPPEGFVATANQAIVVPGYPYYLGDSWDYGYRSQRIVDRLQAKGRLSIADMSALQLDDRNGFAPALTPYLLRIRLRGFDAIGQRLLRRWDFKQPAGSAAAAYFNAVWRNVLSLTFHDDLPEMEWPDRGSRWFAVVSDLLRNPASHWWDDRATKDVVETRDDILKQAMLDARDELIRLQDRDPAKWAWGNDHILDLENQTIGSGGSGIANALLNRGGFAVGGGDSVVNATGWDASKGYTVVWAPSMRMVVSLKDFDDSRWINLTGASGHAFDDHYTDQTKLWVAGRTLPFLFSLSASDRAARATLDLVPDRAR
jgi:penicillin amidase